MTTPAIRRPLVLEPARGWTGFQLAELWQYRELLYFLTWRDVRVRYKQTLLGVGWAVLQPVLQTCVFLYFFGRLAGFADRSQAVPYVLHVFSGQVLWTLFSQAVTGSSSSLVGSTQLVTKVYFPRLIIPLASVGVALVDLAVVLVPLAGLMAWHGVFPSVGILLAPAALLLTLCAAAGLGCLLAAVTAAYRDVRYVVPFAMQLWFFLSPVVYPDEIVPADLSTWLSLNPLHGLIRGFRAALFPTALQPQELAVSGVVSLLLLAGGAAYFKSVERRFADVL